MSTPIGPRALIRLNDPRSQRFCERAAQGSGVARRIDEAGVAIVLCSGIPDSSTNRVPVNREAPGPALAALDETIEADPTNGEYRKQRARTYARLRLYYLAEQELLAAASFQPNDPALPLLRLQLRLERGDKLDLAALPAGQE